MEIQKVGQHWRSLVTLGVLATLLVAGTPPATAYEETVVSNGGAITGRVWFADEYPESESFKIPKDNHVCGIRKPDHEFIVDEATKGLKNVVVEVRGVQAGRAMGLAEPVLGQKECSYVPHVQVAPVGSEVSITNSDPILHNIHAYGGERTLFNIAQPPVGNLEFRKALKDTGVVKVVCDVHDWMAAYIYVVDHPYVAVSDSTGAFSIPDLPPGTYELAAWHEALGEITKTVTVTAGATARADFEIGK